MSDACLHSPLLAAWLAFWAQALATACHLLEVPDEHCPLVLQQPQPDRVCATPGLLAGLAAAVLLAVAALAAAWRRLRRFWLWLVAPDGTQMVEVAEEVLGQLRKAQVSLRQATTGAQPWGQAACRHGVWAGQQGNQAKPSAGGQQQSWQAVQLA